MKILIVDDDRELGDEVADGLARQGLDVRMESDPHRALETIEADPGSSWIVIIDAVMPVLDGLSLGTVLRERFPNESDLQIIIMTGHPTTELAISAVRLKVHDFLKKPIDFERLHESVSRAISSMYMKKMSTADSSVGGSANNKPGAGSHELDGLFISRHLTEILSSKRRYLPEGFGDDVSFQLLIELYNLHCRRQATPVTNLYYLTELPMSTALRRVQAIIDQGLAEKIADEFDGRRQLIRMTEKGADLVGRLLADVEAKVTGAGQKAGTGQNP